MKKEELKCHQDVPSYIDHMLKACRPCGDNVYVKMCLRIGFLIVLCGDQFTRHRQSRVVKKKVFQLEVGMIIVV
jgi:hypothetical protein